MEILCSRHNAFVHLRHRDGNRATGGQRGTGTRGTLHHGVNSFFFVKKKFQMKDSSLAGNLISWQSTGIKKESVTSTPTAHTFFSCAFCQRALPSLLSQLSFRLQSSRHAVTSRTCAAQAQHEALRIVCCPTSSHLIAGVLPKRCLVVSFSSRALAVGIHVGPRPRGLWASSQTAHEAPSERVET